MKKVFTVVFTVFFAVVLFSGVSFAKSKKSSTKTTSTTNSTTSGAVIDVNGYTKKNGTYVAPHKRTKQNSTELDNFSTQGNVNPYTGKKGTKVPKK